MTDPTGPEATPPGWYRETPDSTAYRWWDGRDWTDFRSDAPAGSTVHQPSLPSGTRVNTVWIWLLSLLPLISLVAQQPALMAYGPLLRTQLRLQREILADPSVTPSLPSGFGNFGAVLAIGWGTSLILLGLAVLAAHLDWRALKHDGIVRPFPWGWGFLPGVYIVGRAVVAHRRTGRGLAPLWVAIAFFVVALGIQIAEFSSIFAEIGLATPTN